MGLDDTPPHGPRVKRPKKGWRVLGNLLARFKCLPNQNGVGPFIALSSLIIAIGALLVATDRFEAGALTKQLENDQVEYEKRQSQMQTDIESRIPPRVRSPLPIFPENDQTLLLEPTKQRPLTLEWADRDREHRHKYIVQLVCIAAIPNGGDSKNSESKRDTKPRCGSDKLDEDTLDKDTEDGEKLDREKNYHWTLPGMDRHKVEITETGTYAWRVARGDIDRNGVITIFQDWSPYSIFTVFETIKQRVEVMRLVRVGVVNDSKLKQNEKKMVGSAEEMFKKEFEPKSEIKPTRYSRYTTYEALIAAVARGEVDYAIGGITRAKYREKYGIFFTRGYKYALPIFVSKPNRTEPPGDGDIIGVVQGSVNERALTRLAESKKFVVLKELTLDALKDDLGSDSVNYIFTEWQDVAHLLQGPASNGLTEFVSAGTLYSKLKDFYYKELGYPAMHAIATADEELCIKLNEQVQKEYKQNPYNTIVRQIYTIYREEGETFFNVSLYLRAAELFFPGGEQPCVKS